MQIQAEISALGTRSAALQSRMVDPHSGRQVLLHRCSIICTAMDSATGARRSVSLPQWFLDGLPHLKPEGGPAEAWPRRLQPCQADAAFVGSLKVRPSDTDVNGHVNNASYVDFALDCIADAVRAGCLRGFPQTTDAAHEELRSVQVQYEREAFWGDLLEVSLFELGSGSGTSSRRHRPVAFEIRRPSSGNLLLVLGVVTYAPAKPKPLLASL